jgi:peptidoglycan/LPS O-acetylase OafA/YrhL
MTFQAQLRDQLWNCLGCHALRISAGQSGRHFPELDGIRGLAIVGVLCSHGAGLSGLFDGSHHSVADKLLRYACVPLWGGVDLFFVLSGFLITGILLRTKTSENYFSSFYARRVLRIFPIYYLVLTLSVIGGHVSTAFARQLPAWTSWRVAYFLYVQNWPMFWHGEKMMSGIWGAYWSLAVEEQFYFIWPLVVSLLPEKTITWICFLGVACALPLRIFLSLHYFGISFGLAQITSSRVDGLFLGAACAIYMFRHKRPVPMRWIIASGSVGLMVMGYIVAFHHHELVGTENWMTTLGITGFALLSGALVAISPYHIKWIDQVLTMSWLRAAGKYSYGIYVYHLFIFLPLRALGNRVGLWERSNFPERIVVLITEMITVFLIAKISYDLFESRFLLLKRYFKPNEEPSLSRSGCPT